MITRFAPSPTGYLHLGHALAAKRAFGFAKVAGGVCHLRIEDIDSTRCRPEFTDAIFEDLAWLGFDWPKPARVQSEHLGDYDGALEALKSRGLAYPCFLTRREIAAAEQARGAPYAGPDTPPGDDEVAAKIKTGQTPAWRLSMTAAKAELGAQFNTLSYTESGKAVPIDANAYGDVVIARKDIGTSYHLAVTCDDAMGGITDVVRGQDLQAMTGLHTLIQTLMGWAHPDYHHHALIMKNETDKLSKRSGDTSVRALRDAGYTALQVLDMAERAVSD